MTDEPIKYGWYSAKQAEVTGTNFYHRADGNGEVEITMVADSAKTPGGFDDWKSVGRVQGWARAGSPAPEGKVNEIIIEGLGERWNPERMEF